MPKKKSIQAYDLSMNIAELALTKKASDVIIMDLKGITTMTDYFVICSGDSDKQVNAIADAIKDGLEEEKIKPWHTEGMKSGTWVLMDFVDVVLHVFYKDTREFFNLEDLWGDAEIKEIKENSVPDGAQQGINDFRKHDYGGPCPPSGVHRYFFKLYALDTLLDLSPKARKSDLEKAMKGHILKKTEIIGLYKRK